MSAQNAVELVPVKSSKLLALGYDEEFFILRASFNPSGSVYDYFDVPPEIWSGLQKAKSIGSYFGEHVAGKRGQPPPFEFGKLDTPKWEGLWATVRGLGGPAGHADTVAATEPAKALEGEVVAPVQAVAEPIAQVELPSDEAGLTARAEDAVRETGLLLVRQGSVVRLAVPNAENYAHAVALVLAKKTEKARALEEVAKIKGPATKAWQAACAFEKKVIASYDQAIGPLDQAAIAWKREVEAAERAAAEEARRTDQARLDAENATRAREAQETATREAENMRSAGQHEVAAAIEAAPLPTFREVAPIRVAPTAVPQVAGTRANKVWRFKVAQPELVPRHYTNHIAMALMRAGLTVADDKLGPLVMEIGRAFEEFHSIDEVKLGGRIRPMKDAGVGFIPGVDVWDEESTGRTGR